MRSSEARPLPRPALLERGGAGVLTTALATAVVLLLLVTLLWIVAANALIWFRMPPITEFRLTDGRVILGQIVRREPSRQGARAALLVKTGNRELTGQDHLILDELDIVSADRPPGAVVVVRSEGGDASGFIIGAAGFSGRAVDITDRGALDALLGAAADERHLLRDALARYQRLRRPLTDAEHRLQDMRRSSGRTPAPLLATAEVSRAELARQLGPKLALTEREIAGSRDRLETANLVLQTPSGDIRVPLIRVEEVVWRNRMSGWDNLRRTLRVSLSFLVTAPREANTEGGIYPALFGTVLMVLLMSIAVMPLGVLAAVYLYEYAREGPMLRIADQAVNNLAGVPSIVFGMFGLAFFVHGVGGRIDRSIFPDHLPSPTFGTGGILWASLTLAVLTIPVVVVATREGLQGVPPGWREGAFALGATRFQTLRRIVLPAALPGILTGFILSVSRAAGEVAPLMLTGAVKLANGLPVDGEPPFLHLQRKFMHLSFHVYDVSMQSPNVEAAKPMAFASTLVLLLLVVAVNLTAIIIRRRVRARYRVLEG